MLPQSIEHDAKKLGAGVWGETKGHAHIDLSNHVTIVRERYLDHLSGLSTG